MSALLQLDTLQQHRPVRAGTLGAAALSRHAQSQPGLLAALPPAFAPVLQQLLDRLESSALFTDESCSFSQHDLLDHLQHWIDKARIRLG
jgi:hypothetical protein